MYSLQKYCAPNIKFDGTCYTLQQLKNIASAYNSTHIDQIRKNQTKAQLWKNIKEKMSQCDNEMCWMKSFFSNVKSPFKPQFNGPQLDSTTIENILNSYNNSNFSFLGVGPSDSYKKRIYKKYLKPLDGKKNAFVINLSPEKKEGTHWVGIFIDANIYYFDPLGNKPTKDLQKFLTSLQPPGKIIINKTIYQQSSNMDCGFYVLKFIKNKILGVKNSLTVDREEFVM